MKKYKFWKDNRLDKEYSLTEKELAKRFKKFWDNNEDREYSPFLMLVLGFIMNELNSVHDVEDTNDIVEVCSKSINKAWWNKEMHN